MENRGGKGKRTQRRREGTDGGKKVVRKRVWSEERRLLNQESPEGRESRPYDGLGPDLPAETPSGHKWRTAGQAQEKKDFPSAGPARMWRPGTQMLLLVTAQ